MSLQALDLFNLYDDDLVNRWNALWRGFAPDWRARTRIKRIDGDCSTAVKHIKTFGRRCHRLNSRWLLTGGISLRMFSFSNKKTAA